MRILIAEDDMVSRLVLSATLQKFGHEVTATADGQEAWDALSTEHFPLLISDWMMPDMDGLELCQLIRSTNQARYTYIILLSVLGGKTSYLDAMDAGTDDFITKPFDEDQLAARLRVAERILALHETLREANLALEQRVQARTTELSAANEQLAASRDLAESGSRAKSEFLSRMSHELRTPLNAILGFGQILEMRVANHRDKEAVGHILRGGAHLLELVNEVLDIARIESGHLHVSVEPVLLNRLLQEVTDLITPVAAQYNVHLRHANDGQSVPAVLADQQRLKQVLLNLLSNAIKYNRPGGNVTFHYATIPADTTAHSWVRIEVCDDGPGIVEEDLSRLFKPFERLQETQASVEGIGLGLAVCQGMIHAMGGRIGLESQKGQGTTAWVELPATAVPQEIEAEISRETPPVSKGETRHTVLLIEDNLANLRLIEHLLAGQPQIHLLAAMQGQVGLDLAQQHRPDLILLDRGLPDISGDEVLERLQADPASASIPVVIISADALPAQLERLKAAGAHAYLTKPININEFLKTVQELLQKKE